MKQKHANSATYKKLHHSSIAMINPFTILFQMLGRKINVRQLDLQAVFYYNNLQFYMYKMLQPGAKRSSIFMDWKYRIHKTEKTIMKNLEYYL